MLHSKQPPTSKKFTALTKLLLSHFHNIIRVIESLPQRSSEEDGGSKDVEMTLLALSESAKLLPYVIGSRKAVKVYLKVGVLLWYQSSLLICILDMFGPVVFRSRQRTDCCLLGYTTIGLVE